jgi:hypothetical protein
VILEVGIAALVGVSVRTDVQTDSVFEHGVEVVVQSDEPVKAFRVLSAADERVVRIGKNEPA